MSSRPSYLFDIIVACISFGLLRILLSFASVLQVRSRRWARLALVAYGAVIAAGVSMSVVWIARLFPNLLVVSVRGFAIAFVAILFYGFVLVVLLRSAGAFRPERRRLLQATVAVAVLVPATVASFAIVKREELIFTEIDLPVRNLPQSLQGLRLVQLTDIHLSPFVSERLLARAVDMANETQANVALVTGDLISRPGDPLDKCLQHLTRLRSDAGTYGCLGNHEIYAKAEEYTTARGARLGMTFLRGQALALRFGGATLNLVGVDYQKIREDYLIGTEELLLPGATNLLLSHNPDVFPAAVRKGFDVTIAGHTHGGQVNFEMVHPWLNIVRFRTPYVYGKFVQDGSSLFVGRGIGTIGIPARLNAPPEVALIRLCGISS